MTKLDRYILRQYLTNFVILVVVFIVLFVVVDAVVHFDEFVRVGQDKGVIVGLLGALWDYYAPVVPFLYVFMSGLLVVAAMGFTFAGLSRTGELVAMVTSGVSMYRIAMWVVIAGFALNVLALVDQEFVIPSLASRLTRSASEVGKAPKPIDVNYAVDGKGNLLSATVFDPKNETLQDVTILRRTSTGLAHSRITADSAKWEEAKQLWVLTNGHEVRPGAGEEGVVGNADDVSTFQTSLTPQVLLAQEEAFYPRLLGMRDLEKLADNPAVDSAAIRQIMWSRFSMIVMSLLILVMGLPFFLLREPANMLMQGVKAAGVCVGAWATGLTLLQVSATMINPVASAWLPVVIYLPIAACLLLMVKT